jgi:FAD synthetase
MKVLIFGTFDHLHPGHRFVIDSAALRGRVFIVVARDANVQKIKGKQARQSMEERMAAIQNSYPQAHVIAGHAEDFLEPVRTVKPDLILLGYDQKLPPGVKEVDLPCHIERLPAFEPKLYKSSLRRSL